MVGIYFIQNKTTGKVYVGQSVEIEERWKRHRQELCANKHHNRFLQRAWNKYGQDDFVFQVAEQCDKNKKILNDKETYWKIYFDKINGTYNLGATGNALTMSEETKQKISSALKSKHYTFWKGKHHTKATLKIMSANAKKQWANMTIEEKARLSKLWSISRKGRKGWNKGKHLTEEHKRKISEGNKGKTISQQQKDIVRQALLGTKRSQETINKIKASRHHKSCVQLDKNGNFVNKFSSITEAHNQTGIGLQAISKVCKHLKRYKTAGGYIWVYTNEYERGGN